MHEIVGDLFESELADAICITTNGFVNTQGANTMGQGCAGRAKVLWPGIQMAIGAVLREFGNTVITLTSEREGRIAIANTPPWPRHYVPYHILTFPTKPESCQESELLGHYRNVRSPLTLGPGPYPGWMAKSSLELILQSAQALITQVNVGKFNSVVLPRPGCGLGGLSWEDEVRPLLARILDQRFYVINFN